MSKSFHGLAMLLALAAPHCGERTHHSSLTTHHSLLRVCADPDNLPFSNAQQQGFENKIADLIASDFDARVSYTWLPQRIGFVRNTLKRGDCDVIIGVPFNYEQAAETQPYYRSTYVFVARNGRAIESLDDPRLKKMRIGVQVPSAVLQALASRHLNDNVRGYPVLDEGSRDLIDAIARGDVDIAIMWGPQAGYFARAQRTSLDLVPVTPQIDPPFLPFVFDISMGVRRGDVALKEKLDREIERRQSDIDRILDQYGVPRV